jgi:hypothetical protein
MDGCERPQPCRQLEMRARARRAAFMLRQEDTRQTRPLPRNPLLVARGKCLRLAT